MKNIPKSKKTKKTPKGVVKKRVSTKPKPKKVTKPKRRTGKGPGGGGSE